MNVRRRSGKMQGAMGGGPRNTVTKLVSSDSCAKPIKNAVSSPKECGPSKIKNAVSGPSGS